jgi:cytochrome c-type biogenesis protein CcmH
MTMIMVYFVFCLILLAALAIILIPIFRCRDFSIRQRYLLAGTVSTFFFAGMFGLYYVLGAPEVLRLEAQHDQKMALLKNAIVTYSEQVKKDPNDAVAWFGLGQSFMQTGQYKGASNAFKEAVKLSEGNPQVILAYVGAMMAESNGKISDAAKKGLEMVLLQEPKNPEARYLMAVRMVQEGKKEDALKTLKELFYTLPNDSPLLPLIQKQLNILQPVQ